MGPQMSSSPISRTWPQEWPNRYFRTWHSHRNLAEACDLWGRVGRPWRCKAGSPCAAPGALDVNKSMPSSGCEPWEYKADVASCVCLTSPSVDQPWPRHRTAATAKIATAAASATGQGDIDATTAKGATSTACACCQGHCLRQHSQDLRYPTTHARLWMRGG